MAFIRSSSRWTHLALAAALVALAAVALAFFLSQNSDDAGGPRPPSVQVAAGARSFTIGGTFTPGPNRIAFNNAAPAPRNAQLIRLDEGRSPGELLATITSGQRWPDWARYIGGPGLTEPGRSMLAEVDLEPGQYVMLSLLPDRGGALRIEPGVVQAFAVSGEPNGASVTRPTLTVTTRRGGFDSPERTREGEVRIRLLNEDDTPHDLSVIALAPGRTIEDVAPYLDGRGGPTPGVWVGGIQAIEPGDSGMALLFLTPGEYALVSLFPEPDGVTPGFQVGLIGSLRVE